MCDQQGHVVSEDAEIARADESAGVGADGFMNVDDPMWKDVGYDDLEREMYIDVQKRFNTQTCAQIISILHMIGMTESSDAQKMYDEIFVEYCNENGIHA